jgi:hypothetical protein
MCRRKDSWSPTEIAKASGKENHNHLSPNQIAGFLERKKEREPFATVAAKLPATNNLHK